jgi:alkylation response protein AidB-like acyl-CoA dehydrogenase
MPELLISRRDLEFQLYDWLDAEALCMAPRHAEHSRETFDAVLDGCERLANECFAPHYQTGDREEPRFEAGRVRLPNETAQALRAFADSGMTAATQDAAFGGMQLPTLVEQAALSYLYAANIAFCAYPMLSLANARLLLAHGSPAQVDAFARPQLEGRWLGTMCLSEPQAGSSLADVATRAEYEGESEFGPQYRICGRKMWISGGEHELAENIVHLVLGKIPGDDGRPVPGVRGLSLFAVPRILVGAEGALAERNDVALAGINHKMGYRGTVNCALNFGEGTAHRPGGRAGAIGYLVGQPGQGLACMFHMMNEARIGVGMGAAALGYTGYLHALDYARHRPQGRLQGAAGKDPASPQVPLVAHADVRRMLLAQKAWVEGGMGLALYCARLFDQARIAAEAHDADGHARATLLLDILTPIAKSWPSQWCLAANDLAIQVHGGYGYTREYKVEQFYRDNRLNPIHEGTHGIQALDLLGRKVRMRGGAALEAYAALLQTTIAKARACGLDAGADSLAPRLQRLLEVTAQLWEGDDASVALANASTYLEAFGHLTVAWIWLEQALAAHGRGGDFHDGKRQTARYFLDCVLPSIDPQLDLLSRRDRTCLDMQDAWF